MFILKTVEEAFVNYFMSSSISASTVNIYTGTDSENKEAPALIIYAMEGQHVEPDLPDLGVWKVKTEFKVKEIAADSNVTSSLASDIYEVLMTGNNVKSFLNNSSSLFCYDIFVDNTANTQDGDAWVQATTLDVVCAFK